MNPKYIKFDGKHPAARKESRQYYDKPRKGWNSYGASYSTAFFKLDIDDFNHKTGEIEEPIHGRPRSDTVVAILDSLGIRYNGIATEHGKHLFFRVPEGMEQKNKGSRWLCPLGIKCEWKFPASDDHIPLKINGVERKFFKGSITNEDIDELPPFLYPLQMDNAKFKVEFPEGDRTQRLGAYIFYLVGKGYTAEQAFQIVRLMNTYVFENPIPDNTLDAEILNESTLKKAQSQEEKRVKKKEVSPDTFKNFLDEMGMSIQYNELLNIVEFVNVPVEILDMTDTQNIMPIALQYAYRDYTGVKSVTKQQVIDLIAMEADKNSYNPIRDYLQSTPWDGKDRFPELFDILGVKNCLEQVLIRKWFYQSAALPFNVLDDPFQPEGVLIFCGGEGIKKTRFFRTVAVNPRWFTSLDKPVSTKNKDILIEMLSSWITEIGEIDCTFTERRSDLKSFMTSEKDTIRKPYAREPVTKARTTSMCGTTNKSEFLNEGTGDRRWWVVNIPGKIDLDRLTSEYLMQLWAQCYKAFVDNPQCFRLTDSELKEIKVRNREVREMLPAEDELRLRLDFDAPESEWSWVQPSALKNLHEFADIAKYDAATIGRALANIAEDFPAMQFRKKHGTRKWFIPPAIEGTDRFRNRDEMGGGGAVK